MADKHMTRFELIQEFTEIRKLLMQEDNEKGTITWRKNADDTFEVSGQYNYQQMVIHLEGHNINSG